jgi:hypothetical protein
VLILKPSQLAPGSVSRLAIIVARLQALGSVSNLDAIWSRGERNEKLDLRNKFPRRGTFETISLAALVFDSVIDSKETA